MEFILWEFTSYSLRKSDCVSSSNLSGSVDGESIAPPFPVR